MSMLPEPTFEFLVATLGMQAQMHMGMMSPDPSQPPAIEMPAEAITEFQA